MIIKPRPPSNMVHLIIYTLRSVPQANINHAINIFSYWEEDKLYTVRDGVETNVGFAVAGPVQEDFADRLLPWGVNNEPE